MKNRSNYSNGSQEHAKSNRPPCRQSEFVYHLDLSENISRKPIRVIKKQVRLPSRNRTPPKALNLENNSRAKQEFPINSFSFSQPVNFRTIEKPFQCKPRADSANSKGLEGKGFRLCSAGFQEKYLRSNLQTSKGSRANTTFSQVKQFQKTTDVKTDFLDLFDY